MSRGIFSPTTSNSYLFLMSALLFGFPMLTAYYAVNPTFFYDSIVPYLSAIVFLTLFLVSRSKDSSTGPPGKNPRTTSFPARFNSLPRAIVLILLVWTAALYSVIAYIFYSSYPFPVPSKILVPIGIFYFVLIIAASVFVFSRILYHIFPVLRQVLIERRYFLMTVLFSSAFAAVYLLLVNQVIIAGFNVQLTAPPEAVGGTYPTIFAMVPAVTQKAVDLVYLPILLVQVNATVNLILIPFEMIFATVLSLLVGSNIALTNYLITHSGLRCSTRGTILTTGGSILGLTATCPACLAPTLVSVIFGGVSTSIAVIYSNVYGVVIPPVLSLIALVAGIVFVSRRIARLSYDKKS